MGDANYASATLTFPTAAGALRLTVPNTIQGGAVLALCVKLGTAVQIALWAGYFDGNAYQTLAA